MIPERILPGQLWREVKTGRLITILEEEVYGTGPAWSWNDTPGWHYCDIADFVIWRRFEFVG